MPKAEEVARWDDHAPTEYDARCEWGAANAAWLEAAEREECRRSFERSAGGTAQTQRAPLVTVSRATPATQSEVCCPKCGGRMWDNRVTKRNPRAPDFKCRSRSCSGVIWPPKSVYQDTAAGDVRFYATDGRYFASDADRRAHDRMLAERAGRRQEREDGYYRRHGRGNVA